MSLFAGLAMSGVGTVGSGIDVASIVQQLVSADRAPSDARNDRTDRQLKAQISAIGTLRGAFSGLRTAVNALSSNNAVLARKTTVPEGSGFTAAAAPGAAVGRYQVEVKALATAHKLSSAPFLNSDTVVGSGTLNVTAGSTTLALTIDETNNSLAGIRDAINTAAAGKGVSASIVTADDGAHLILTALDTGVVNAVRVTTSGGDGGLAALVYDAPTTTTMAQVAEAKNAEVEVDGFLRTSPSNTVINMIGGVTMTLTKAEPAVLRELNVAGDPVALRTAAKSFVTAYNIASASIATTTAYNTTTKVAAALNGDSMVRGASRQLRDQVGAQTTDLKAIGITIAKDGTLTLNEAAFDAAMAADAGPATRLFQGPNSLAVSLDTTLDRLVDADGLLESRSDGLNTRTRTLEKQRAALDFRMTQVEARYRAQFVGLDSIMSKLQSTSTFLSQQLNLL
jgi:flagellar hook-associated protein 2